nr:hypothetical protein [Micromonospora sp. DSM 115978]
MLQIRVEGDPAESQALLDKLAQAGIEIQVGAAKRRSQGITHTYAVVRLPDWPTPDSRGDEAVRTRSHVDRPALAAGRRPSRREGR